MCLRKGNVFLNVIALCFFPLIVSGFFALLLVYILWAADGRKKKNKWNVMVVLNKSLNHVHLLE